MELFFRKYGNGSLNIIILHGLYGSSDNWVSIAKILSQKFTVYIPDQRNHGQSPHSAEFNYNVLINDLYNFIVKNKIDNPVIIGHSMGGKVAMYFNYTYPQIAKKLIIIDIVPKDYSNDQNNKFHRKLILFMSRLNLNNFKNRKDLSDFIFNNINDKRLTHFILKNLKREDNSFSWKINIETISNELQNILSEEYNKKIKNINTPTLFIKAEDSGYIKPQDFYFIKSIFKNVEIKSIKNTSHWIHSEKPAKLCELIFDFV